MKNEYFREFGTFRHFLSFSFLLNHFAALYERSFGNVQLLPLGTHIDKMKKRKLDDSRQLSLFSFKFTATSECHKVLMLLVSVTVLFDITVCVNLSLIAIRLNKLSCLQMACDILGPTVDFVLDSERRNEHSIPEEAVSS